MRENGHDVELNGLMVKSIFRYFQLLIEVN